MVEVDHAAILAAPRPPASAASNGFYGESAPTTDVWVKVLGQASGDMLPFDGAQGDRKSECSAWQLGRVDGECASSLPVSVDAGMFPAC